jgi:hypothetical protein
MNHSKRLLKADPMYEGFEIVANKTKMLKTKQHQELTPGELRDVGMAKKMTKKNAAAEEKRKAEERLALLKK